MQVVVKAMELLAGFDHAAGAAAQRHLPVLPVFTFAEWVRQIVLTYAESHGRPAHRDEPDGSWCRTQRGIRQGTGQGRLTPERIARLGAVPEMVVKSRFGRTLRCSFRELLAYAERHGRPPAVQESSLGQWCGTQRATRPGNHRRTPPLADDQIRRMEAGRGLAWDVQTVDQLWERQYRELLAYAESHGRTARLGRPGARDVASRTGPASDPD